jgi:chromosome partitioning protein
VFGEKTLADVRLRAANGEYDVVPANRDLAGAEVEMVDLEHRETRLKDAIAIHAHEYEYVLIDCPPALNLLTVNGLTAAQAVMIPMQCEYYALEGLSDLVQTVKKVRAHLNPCSPTAQFARTAGVGSTAAAFRRQGISHRDPAQYSPGGSAQPRFAGDAF